MILLSLRLGKHEIGGASHREGGERSHKEPCPCLSLVALLGMAAKGDRFLCSVALQKWISYSRNGGRWISKQPYRSNSSDGDKVGGLRQGSWGLPSPGEAAKGAPGAGEAAQPVPSIAPTLVLVLKHRKRVESQKSD